MIICKNCGEENGLESVLCLSCGQKIDINDAEFVISSSSPITEEKTPTPPSEKTIIQKISFFFPIELFIKLIFFLCFCYSLLGLYTGHIKKVPLNTNEVKTYHQKWNRFIKTSSVSYDQFNERDLTIYIEKKLTTQPLKFNSVLPKWIAYKDILINLKEGWCYIHLIFKIKQKRFTLSFQGKPKIKNNRISFEPYKTQVGKISVGTNFILKKLQPLLKSIKDSKLLNIDSKIQSIAIQDNQLTLYKNKTNTLQKDGTFLSNKTDNEEDLKLPQDSIPEEQLMLQVGDTYFEDKNWNLALKYYHLTLVHYPQTPKKKYVKDQIKLASQNLSK